MHVAFAHENFGGRCPMNDAVCRGTWGADEVREPPQAVRFRPAKTKVTVTAERAKDIRNSSRKVQRYFVPAPRCEVFFGWRQTQRAYRLRMISFEASIEIPPGTPGVIAPRDLKISVGSCWRSARPPRNARGRVG